ncbi:hypothetical protein CSA56_07250 [candidate division KSB3 bacterium]|uniref:Glycosyl transferase family 1 domain-containing protein n=1 Tax=candidate division KSB3 bacterium TaxID=2044937 RepID=A0A2G6KG33_9BACT|nr:MAG: hypothetical protein CSA56_07250 [candidate division KSB3 bacterium]
MRKKTIRVAFWHNVFSPYRVPVFQKLAAYDDIDLTVYYGSAKDSHRAWDVDFGAGYHYELLPSLSIPYYPHKFNYTFFTELCRKKYDVYIAVENEIGGQIAYLAKMWTKTPLILWSVEIVYEIVYDRQGYTLQDYLRRLPGFLGRRIHGVIFSPFHHGALYVKRHADAYLAAGRETEKHLKSVGAPGPFFCYGNTIDTTHLSRELNQKNVSELKQHLGIEGKTVILSVSYLQERKGVQYLIEAYRRIQYENTVLLIVGDGEYKQALLRLVPEDRKDILFVGHDEDTAQYYAIADIFVMPSFSDPWGLTVNEAMVAGLPVITTTNVGAQELIQGNGFLVPPRDSHAIQKKIELLLHAKSLRIEMGGRSREIIRDYTIEHIAETCREAIYAVT